MIITEKLPEQAAHSQKKEGVNCLGNFTFKQCPYCIEAYTTASLEAGANPDQMTEAIHVSAAMAAGMNLVHGVQMLNILERTGA